MSTRNVCRTGLSILILSVALLASAGEARIPIWEPTIITAPGKYIVTREIVGTGGLTCIVIDSNGVDLDLNGMILNNLNMNQPVIEIGPDRNRIRIHNGFLVNGSAGIQMNGNAARIKIENLTMQNIRYNVKSVVGECDHCRIANNIMYSTFTENIVIDAGRGIEILNNSIRTGDTGTAIRLGAAATMSGPRIVENSISAVATCMELSTTGAQIRDNVLANCGVDGIVINNGDGNYVHDNTVTGCGGDGIRVDTSYNQIQQNTLNQNGRGLVFNAGSVGNVYRSNTARGNGTDFTDLAGAGVNTSHGDNYLPTLR